MSTDLRIAPMTLEHLRIAADWAAAEGWNPGIEDAEAFHAVDPSGFLMGWLDDKPATAISVVRHSDSFGFLGFYLCDPHHRGKGFGMATWQAGMAYLGDRVVGLDGVPAQEENYQRSGFVLAHYTKRYAGEIEGKAHVGCRAATPEDLPVILALDRRISGTERATYVANWVQQSNTRQTLVCGAPGDVHAFGTIRACRDGHKIGPLFAPDRQTALRLIESLILVPNAESVMIDVPDPNQEGVELASSLGLQPVFSCARMYRGEAPDRQIGCIYGETTFELG